MCDRDVYPCQAPRITLLADGHAQATGTLELEGPVVETSITGRFIEDHGLEVFWDCFEVSASDDGGTIPEVVLYQLTLMLVYSRFVYAGGAPWGGGLILKRMEDGSYTRVGWFKLTGHVSEFLAAASSVRVVIV